MTNKKIEVPVELVSLLEKVVSTLSTEVLTNVVKKVQSLTEVSSTNLVNDLVKVLTTNSETKVSYKIWNELNSLKLNIFGMENEKFEKYFIQTEVEDSKLYFKLRDSYANATSLISLISQVMNEVYPNKYELKILMNNLYSVEVVSNV